MRRLTRRQRTAALVLAAVALAFMTLDLGGGSLRGAHNGVRGTLGALYRGTDAVLGPARRWLQGLPDSGRQQGRIDALERQNAELRAQLAALDTTKRTSATVDRLDRAATVLSRTLLPARVTALGPGQGFDWTVTLDVGTRGGVRAGQTVVDGADLVGRVLRVDADSCTVLLAADPGAGVGVRDGSTGELGVVTGQGSAGLTYAPLKPGARVGVGDELRTGPVGATSFVPGLAVGTVTAVRRSADGTVRAEVRPASSPTTLDIVAIVVGNTAGLAERPAADVPGPAVGTPRTGHS